MMQEHQRAI
jgi:hypothetical protein